MRARMLGLLLAVATGCESSSSGLSVDVKTDFQPGVEFVAVRSELTPAMGAREARSVDATAAFGDPFLAGRRVAEYDSVATGDYTLRVELRDARGGTVASRTTRLSFTTSVAVTILLTRDCRGIVCPVIGGDPLATTCVGGRCVDPGCVTGMEPSCMSECTSDSACPTSAAACAIARCVDGSCLFEARDDRCAMGEYCAVDTGCRLRPVAPLDAGPPSTVDAGPCTTSTAEVCNGRDDDCNGIVDDGFDLTRDPLNCDACGRACTTVPNATATCSGGACSFRCDAGFEDIGGTCMPAGRCPSGMTHYYLDADRDRFGAGTFCPGCYTIGMIPAGCSSDNTDCDDSNPAIWQALIGFRDSDGDGYGFFSPVPMTVCSGAALPPGYVSMTGDCNDSQGTVHPGAPFQTSSAPGGGTWDYDCSGMIEVQYPAYERCDSVISSLPLAYCDGVKICTATGTEVGDWCVHAGIAAGCGELTAVDVSGRCDTACNMHLSPGPLQGCR